MHSNIYARIAERSKNQSDFLDYDGILQLSVTGDQSANYIVDFTELEASVYEGQMDEADCTITLADKDFLALTQGKLTPRQAFQGGKLKIEGDNRIASAALKLLV